MEGNTIDMVNGYPDFATVNDTLTDITGITYDPGTGLFAKDGAATPATCSIDHNEANPGSRPFIVVDVFGC